MVEPEGVSGAEIIDKVREVRVGTEAIKDTVLKQNVKVYIQSCG